MSLSIPRGNIKPLSTVHQHFEDLPENGVKCKPCPWTHRKNATRQTEHMKSHKQPVELVEAQSEDDLLDLTAPVSKETKAVCYNGTRRQAITARTRGHDYFSAATVKQTLSDPVVW